MLIKFSSFRCKIYSLFDLFSTKRLALYSVVMIFSALTVETSIAVIIFDIQVITENFLIENFFFVKDFGRKSFFKCGTLWYFTYLGSIFYCTCRSEKSLVWKSIFISFCTKFFLIQISNLKI